MAFTNFYIDVASGGSDMAAGSTTGAILVTSANGDWGSVTANRFTPAGGGTPFSAVMVGMYASIALDATTIGAVYIAQVTAVNGGGATIDLSATIKYGTAPATGATGRTCRVGGSWISEIPITTNGLGSTTVPQSTKVNWKAGTYVLTANRTMSLGGTTAIPLWISGYNTTPGDLDYTTTNALAKPLLSLNATFIVTFAGGFVTWSSFSFVGDRSGAICNMNSASGNQTIFRCRFENVSSNAAAVAFSKSGVGVGYMTYCYFKVPTTATTGAVTNTAGVTMTLFGCVSDAGVNGAAACYQNAGSTMLLLQCIALNGNFGVNNTIAAATQVINCTIYNPVSDGIRYTLAPLNNTIVYGTVFTTCGGYAINALAGVVGTVFRFANDFYSCALGNENNMGDSLTYYPQIDTSNPITSSTDMTLVPGSNAINNEFPGIFENQTFGSYVDIGAVGYLAPVGGGGQAISIFG